MCQTCIYYVEECWRRGIELIVVNPPGMRVSDGSRFRKYIDAKKLKTIDMDSMDDYDDVLEKVRKINPIAIFAGAEGGVFIADRLARDLGYVGNDPKTSYNRDAKDGMHAALKKAGIRYIRTAVVSSRKEVEDFWRKEKLSKVMIKHADSGGSVGNKICYSVEEAADHVALLMKEKNIFEHEDKVLAQEYIGGTEYIVDTVSCEGKHMVTDIWRYSKNVTADGHVIYDETYLVDHPEPGIPELVQYAFKALDATGFEYGPCHGEFKIDEKGPVLIETNPRPCGAAMISEYLDEFLDNHITDVSMDSYIAPEIFSARASKPYRPSKHAMWKMMISPKDCDICLPMLRAFLEHMESFRHTAHDITGEKLHVARTVDLATSFAIIKMANADFRRMKEDCDIINDLETRCFDLLEHGDRKVKAAKVSTDLAGFSAPFVQNRKTLVVTDKGEYVTRNGKKIKDVKDAEGFGAAVYADASACKLYERLESIMDSAERLREDGVIVVAPEVYENLPYGRTAVELALKTAGCELEVRTGNEVPVVARKS